MENEKPDATQPNPVEPSLEARLETAEKRHKDTQAGYTKGQQTIKEQEAIIAGLQTQIGNNTPLVVSAEDQTELDSLKFNEPDAWRAKMNQLEADAQNKSKAELAELTSKASTAAGAEFELDRRKTVLEEFNKVNSLQITEELIANDIPPRITAKLQNNEISFEDFLVLASSYATQPKAIKDEEVLGQPNLGKLGGSHIPGEKAEPTMSELYADTVY